jgi:hypothetical protein
VNAHAVAAPVVGRVPAEVVTGRVLPAGDFTVLVTGPGVPLLPNGISLPAAPAWPARIRLGGAHVWDPSLRPVAGPLRERGAAILAALGRHPPRGLLWRAVEELDPRLAARAASGLCGRGPGLTPAGDDLLAGAAAVVAAFAGAREWLDALVLPDLRSRTTAPAATLLELAAQALVPEPVLGLLDLSPAGERRWRGSLARLLRLGHSTGHAWAFGAGGAAFHLDQGASRCR